MQLLYLDSIFLLLTYCECYTSVAVGSHINCVQCKICTDDGDMNLHYCIRFTKSVETLHKWWKLCWTPAISHVYT